MQDTGSTRDDPALARLADEVTGWRRHLHAHPELSYDVHETARFVAAKLRAFGLDDVVEGIGRTGVVGVIRGRTPGRTVGLRADMDALPVQEMTNLPHASRIEGRMHACGHDGHTAMLLGAARRLADRRDFSGVAVVIFQPAEEAGNGALAMVEDGVMARFGIDEVYGMHNLPGLPAGAFAVARGPAMAAVDSFTIRIEGRGCHAAQPNAGIDPILAGAHVVKALQAIVARNVDPLHAVVVSVTAFQGGEAFNVVPQSVLLRGTVRSMSPAVRDFVEGRVSATARAVAASFGATAEVHYERLVDATVNSPAHAGHAVMAARSVPAPVPVDEDPAPMMAGEDFSFMLGARPGAFVFIGNGETAGLHHPGYDFNDAIIPAGIRFWTELVHRRGKQDAD
ncbi:MAG TPA: M20 aminoacylase family protein [Beijerinckiaceae bacterium]|nr:M20 aminoacylase family protein [Beijerinckiaceae bacterium]